MSQRALTWLLCALGCVCITPGLASGQEAGQPTASVIPPPPPLGPGQRLVDDFTFESVNAAREAWRPASVPGQSIAPVQPLSIDGRPVLKMTCNFSTTTMPRAYWDRAVSLDLSLATAITFDVYAQNLRSISHCHLYIRSGGGWYGCQWYPSAERAWCHVRLRKSDFYVDKPAAGWAKIDTVRVSPWAARREDAVLYFANLAVEEAQAPMLILRQEFPASDKRNQNKAAVKFTSVVSDLLEEAGVIAPMATTLELTPELLQGRRLVVVPYGSGIEQGVAKMLADFVDRGGKVIVCFSAPSLLAQRLGVSLKGWRGRKDPGEFASIRFVEQPPIGSPPVVSQRSWGIIDCEPIPGRGRVAAWWHSEDGRRTDAPALVLCDTGAYFSHVILADDRKRKRDMLKGLVASFCPGVHEAACKNRLAKLGSPVGAVSWPDALERTEALPAFNAKASAALADARKHFAQARFEQAAGRFTQAVAAADRADARLVDAYCLAQRAQTPEFRATWCHPPEGIAGWSWERTADVLHASGIDHLILNALRGASAAYPSRVLPMHARMDPKSTYLADCIKACGQRGIKVHIWMTNYTPGGLAPKAFVDKLRADGRTQVDVGGNVTDYLCPSHELNFQMQRDAMVEAAQIPGVAGIHLDYIRYPNHQTCYCNTCRGKFEARIGRKLQRWPQDVQLNGPQRQEWLQFRCDNITRLVQAVHDEVRRTVPRCMISAAVFRGWPYCKDSVGQDWKLWIDRGYLDFVCPMDYTASNGQFENLVKNQLQVVAGKVPCYPGIGLLEGLGPVGAIQQIQITRNLRTAGFVIWSVYPEYIDEVYPRLGKGILAR